MENLITGIKITIIILWVRVRVFKIALKINKISTIYAIFSFHSGADLVLNTFKHIFSFPLRVAMLPLFIFSGDHNGLTKGIKKIRLLG